MFFVPGAALALATGVVLGRRMRSPDRGWHPERAAGLGENDRLAPLRELGEAPDVLSAALSGQSLGAA